MCRSGARVNRLARTFNFSLFLLCTFSAHAGELYQWVDADGVITYSPEPPPEGTVSEVREISGELASAGEPGSASGPSTADPLTEELPDSLTPSAQRQPIGLMKNESRIERMARLAPKQPHAEVVRDESVEPLTKAPHKTPLDLERVRLNRKCSDLENRISALETRLSTVETAAELNKSMLMLSRFQTMHENSCAREKF